MESSTEMVESSRMLPEQSGEDAWERADDTAASSRRGLLNETVGASVSAILAAPSVSAALPAVLTRLAELVHFDRVVMFELLPHHDRPAPSVFFQWQRPDCSLPSFSIAALEESDWPAFQEWGVPLTRAEPMVTLSRTAPSAVRSMLESAGVVSVLTVPILVSARHWGHIEFDDCAPEHQWPADDIKTLTMLAEVIGAAITRERFQSEAQQREALLQAMNRSATIVATATDLQRAITDALQAMAGPLHLDRLLVVETVSSEHGKRQMLRNCWHAPDTPALREIEEAFSTNPEVLAWREPLLHGGAVQAHRSACKGALLQLLEHYGAQSVLLAPILVDGRHWGNVTLESCRRERVWRGGEADVVKTLAEVIGNAIARQHHIEALALANRIVQNSPTILYRLRGDASLPMTYISQNVALLGYQPEALLASPTRYQEMVHLEDRALVHSTIAELLATDAPSATLEYRVVTREGAIRWVENRCTPVRDGDGQVLEIEGILNDITERKAAEQQIAQLARTDPLTGVANRVTFNDRLRQAYAAAQRGANGFAVLYLDLDRFKEVNDALGHHTGDLLLQLIARRLQKVTREIDTVARLGGDEFAIVQAELGEPEAAGALAAKLIEVTSSPCVIEGSELQVGVSIGIALHTPETTSPEQLLTQADQALYRVKQAGRGRYRFFSDEIDYETRSHLALAEELRGALARHELEIHYQPQVELATGRIVGMEALLRWNHRERGLLLPEDFLPIAEKFGIMQQLGRWALDGACRQMSLWRAQHMSVPVVAINVALAQINLGAEFVRDVMDSIRRWGLRPADIELDVTELVLARTTLAQSNVLEQLRRLGVGVAIDDFGAQYSSLDYLRSYRVNRLKIARGMIATAEHEPGGTAMIRAILSLAGELGVAVVAEGIETETQRSLLIAASAQAQGQGFYYSRAVSAEESMAMLRTGVVLPSTTAVRAPEPRAAHSPPEQDMKGD
jgi:diguanylate cyclase (GGDEF)-like protein/PAS domain S-box-containing protein